MCRKKPIDNAANVLKAQIVTLQQGDVLLQFNRHFHNRRKQNDAALQLSADSGGDLLQVGNHLQILQSDVGILYQKNRPMQFILYGQFAFQHLGQIGGFILGRREQPLIGFRGILPIALCHAPATNGASVGNLVDCILYLCFFKSVDIENRKACVHII